MKIRILPLAVLSGIWLAVTATVVAQPPEGSQLPFEENLCANCHSEPDIWEEDKKHLHVDLETLKEDIHYLKGVNCHDCHGGDPSSFKVPEAHSTEVDDPDSGVLPLVFPIEKVWDSCAKCHEDQQRGMVDGVHGPANLSASATKTEPFTCQTCHGNKAHGILPVKDSRSPVCFQNQVNSCSSCHEEALEEYRTSTHGYGLERSGLIGTALCADCHGAHGIYPASSEVSTLHPTNVAATCATCHRFLDERLRKSVHGTGNGPGGASEHMAPGGNVKRKPTCTDCHEGHDLPHPDTARFRLELPQRCGKCHSEITEGYNISMHGQLTDLGYGAAAECADCHGAHEILPISDPNSMLSAQNRVQTCRKCHPNSPPNFMNFDPHADHRDPERSALLHGVYVVLLTLLFGTFGVFGLHSLFWFVRGLVDVRKNGRPQRMKPGEPAVLRFKPFHQTAHIIMIVSFLGLAATGLPLKYSQQPWAQTLATLLGGFGSTGLWHRIFGVLNIACLAAYAVRMLLRLIGGQRQGAGWKNTVFGPDSPVPNLRDVKDVLAMLRWFVGRGPKPTFERWAYWEKVDFWGACADIVLIGFTGLILWFPSLFCMILPGESLNIAKVVHSTQALLATGFVFAIHFFSTHIRPDKFPMDMSILTGIVTEEELHEERPEYYERLKQEGKLDEFKTTVPSRQQLIMTTIGGTIALSVGIALLVGILFAAFS